MSCNKTITRFLCLLLSLVLLVIAAVACNEPKIEEEEPSVSFETTDRYEALDVIDAIFRDKALFELDDEALIDAILKGYVEGTGDAYAEYFTAEEYAQHNSENHGDAVGIGVHVVDKTSRGFIEIIKVLPDSPALEAGLLPGDLVTYVGIGEERQSVQTLGYEKTLELMLGEEGTLAQLTVQRDGEELEFSIVRRKVTPVSVIGRACETDSTVGVVKVDNFDFTTPFQFEKAVDELISLGCDRFVIDLRDNPGGDTRSLQYVLSFFLKNGDEFLKTVDRNGVEEIRVVEPTQYSGEYAVLSVPLEAIGKYSHLKVAVITNEGTASAAEIFTGVLRDYGLSVTVGEKTYGKGCMQNVYSLEKYGYGGAIKLTTKYCYLPVTGAYDGIGLYPDVEVPLDESLEGKQAYEITDAEDNQLLAAIKELYNK